MLGESPEEAPTGHAPPTAGAGSPAEKRVSAGAGSGPWKIDQVENGLEETCSVHRGHPAMQLQKMNLIAVAQTTLSELQQTRNLTVWRPVARVIVGVAQRRRRAAHRLRICSQKIMR